MKLGLAAALFALALAAHGADFKESALPTISPAAEMIEVPVSPIAAGVNLHFVRKDSASAVRFASTGFQFRIFATLQAGEIPRPFDSQPIDTRSVLGILAAPRKYCDLYHTLVIAVGPTSGKDIEFANMDESWLRLSNSQRTVQDGHYFAVLEKSTNRDPVFRLQRDDRMDYFRQGFSFTVKADDRFLERLRQRWEQGWTPLQGAAQVEPLPSGSAVPCYHYVRYEATAEDGSGQLALCAADESPDAPAAR